MAGPSLLFGRDKECQLLLQAYERSMTGKMSASSCCASSNSGNRLSGNDHKCQRQELVLIQGHSGTGKTTLARSIETQVMERDHGFFLAGKFELSQVKKPYEVFVSSFESFLETMDAASTANDDSNNKNDFGYLEKNHPALSEAVGTEGKLLTAMIPALAKFIGTQDTTPGCDDFGGKEALQRFQLAFSKLIRTVSSIVPIVLFLDDLQWIDPDSMNLLQMVLESPTNQTSCLLVIGAFRDEELIETQPSSKCKNELAISSDLNEFLKNVSSSTTVACTNIYLRNLDEESTVQLVTATFNASSTKVNDRLGSIMYAKSNGNPFHAIQLLSPLMREQLQKDDQGQPSWAWDEADIFNISDTAATVDDMIRQEISLLPIMNQQVIMTAACMGNCIDHPALCTVFDGDVSGVETSLTTLLEHGLILFDRKLGEYRFTHDRVRQAAMSLVDNVQLLQDQAERYKAAAVNQEAGMKAISMASFQDGARFFRSGIAFLEGGDHWTEQYELSLSLYNAAADAEMCNQDSDKVDELVGKIFERAKSVRDKLRAYVVQINSLGQLGRVEAATQVGTEVMKQLGEPLPAKVADLGLLFEIIKTRIALRGRSNMSLLALPPMQDDDRIAAIFVLTNLVTYSFQASSKYIVVISSRIVRLSLKYGIHKCCAFGFAAFAVVMSSLDRKEGYRFGTLAMTMIERYRARELLPRVHMSFYGLISHWRHPLEESLLPLENAYKVGMETGDVEYALNSISFYVGHWLHLGKPLAQIEDTANEAIRTMKLFRQDNMLAVHLISVQFIRNLTGRAPVATILAGDLQPLYDASSTSGSILIPYLNYCLGEELALLLGDLQLAGQLLETKRKIAFEPIGLYHYAKMRFLESLICTGLARNSSGKERTKHIKFSKSAVKQMKAWANDCPQNFQHKLHLMEVELQSLDITDSTPVKRRSRVRELYDRAIQEAVTAGFVEQAGIAYELAGDCLERQNDHRSAREYWNEALKLFTDWGATEKVKQLSTLKLS